MKNRASRKIWWMNKSNKYLSALPNWTHFLHMTFRIIVFSFFFGLGIRRFKLWNWLQLLKFHTRCPSHINTGLFYVILSHRLHGCFMASPKWTWWTMPTCITVRASRTCRDTCRDRWLAVSFDVSGGENAYGIPGACATRNFTYLVRGQMGRSGECRVAAMCVRSHNSWAQPSTGLIFLRRHKMFL